MFQCHFYTRRQLTMQAYSNQKQLFHLEKQDKVPIFAPDKTKKDDESNVYKYILALALVTTQIVVREQRSYADMNSKIA